MQIEGKRAKRSLALLKINNIDYGMLAARHLALPRRSRELFIMRSETSANSLLYNLNRTSWPQ